MKKSIIKISITTILLFVIGIGLYYYLHPKKAMRMVLPEFTGDNFVKAKIKNDTAYISLQSYLTNKAPYKIAIDSIAYTLSLDTVPIIVERKKLNLSQKSGAIDTAILDFKVPITKLRSVISGLQNQDSTFIKGDFELICNTIFGRVNINFSKKKRISAPIPPEIKILKVHKKNIDLLDGEASIKVDLNIINHSAIIDVHLSNIKYHIQLGDGIVAKGSINDNVIINPKSSTNITIPLRLDIDKPLKALWEVFINKEKKDYTVILTAMLSNNNLAKIPIEIEATGSTSLIK